MKKQIILICLYLIPFMAHSQFNMLVWEDDFEYTGLPDTSKWSYDVGGHGWGNNELQYYTNEREENARVEDGKLIIEARKEAYSGNDYTSARLVSRNKGDWTYGRIEARAKLPKGKGTWPAIWMLPTEWIYGDGDWPDVGEIDIMEHVGWDEGVIHGTIHTHDFNHMDGTQQSGQITIPDAVDAFHVYAIEWTEDKIEWYVDDEKYFTYENNGDGWSAWPFDHPFHLILNIAVGGDWGGSEGVADTIFPQKMEIDYVRVYKKKDQLSNLIDGEEKLVPNAANVKFSSRLLNGENYQWSIPDDAEMLSQDTNKNIYVNWGCQEGDVILSTDFNEETYKDTLSISSKDLKIQGDYFWNEENTPLLFFLDSMHTTTFEWSVPKAASIIQGQGKNAISVDWNEANGHVSVEVSNECADEQIQRKILKPDGQYPYPDPYQPHILPGNIEAIHYDYGGEGVAYHDLESTNQGDGPRQNKGVDTEYAEPKGNVGWIETGEWLEYSIEVQDTIFLELSFRTASLGGGGPLSVLINGYKQITDVMIPDTEGWGNFITQNTGPILLTPEDTLLRIEAEGGGFNLGRMQFKEEEATNLKNVHETANLRIYPNPVKTRLVIESNNSMHSVEVLNMLGINMKHKNLPPKTKQFTLDLPDLKPGMYIIRIKTKTSKFLSKQFLKR